jgi:hypothetical protein
MTLNAYFTRYKKNLNSVTLCLVVQWVRNDEILMRYVHS